MVKGSSPSSAPTTRSESERERTKLRERQRRAITTKIFQGLRRYGNYQLSPRADINEVLRQLAKEAGWIVEPDGTTYRFKLVNRCPTCGTPSNGSAAGTPTSTSSTVIGGGGECSTTASPRRAEPVALITSGKINNGGSKSNANIHSGDVDIPLGFYMYGGLVIHQPSTATAPVAGEGEVMALPSQDQ